MQSDRHDAARPDLILVPGSWPSSVYEYEAWDQTCKSAKPAAASWGGGGDNPYLVDCHLEYDLSIMLSSLIQTDVFLRSVSAVNFTSLCLSSFFQCQG